jgi:flagellar protein FliO/FliZ
MSSIFMVKRPENIKSMIRLFLILASLPLWATAEPEKPVDLSLMQVLAPLFFVIVLIFALAWLVKKMNIGTPAVGQGIQILSSTPVSSQARVCLIRVGGKDILLGVTNQQVNRIHTFDEPATPPEEEESNHEFASQFKRLLKGGDRK